MFIAFTLCSNNYLAQAKVLADSFTLHNPESKFIFGLVDKKSSKIDYSFFAPYELVEVSEIGLDNFNELVEKYNIVEFNTAVKPFYIEYLFNKFPEIDEIFYLDPDIAVYAPFHQLVMELQQNDVLLTPHLLKANLEAGVPFEKLVLNVGIFNLGFLGVKRTENVMQFVKWWQNRLKNYCYIDFGEGLFVDQIWANFLPVYFQKVLILKKYGLNVGYWNFHERTLKKSNGSYFVNDEPLLFFHFSNYNPLLPDKLCKWLNYSFEKRKDLVEIYEKYRQDLLKNNYDLFSKVPSGLTFKQNHPQLNKKKPSFLTRIRGTINRIVRV